MSLPETSAAPTLHVMQTQFAGMVATLILKAAELGYEVTLGECYRTPEQAAINAAKGIGISHSLHTERLAIDLNLFKGGLILTKTEEYRPLGEWWETQGGAWGGRFIRQDGGHFSLAYNGRK